MENYIANIIDGKCQTSKDKIVQAALQEFAMSSFGAARTRNIAQLANVNHAGISYYFGGKEELYSFLIKEICSYIKEKDNVYFDKAKDIKILKDPQQAKDLIIDFLSTRLSVDNEKFSYDRYIMSIINREQIFRGSEFEYLYEQLFEPSIKLIGEMLVIILKDKVLIEQANVLAQILIGQIITLSANRMTYKRINNVENFDEDEKAKVIKICQIFLEKISI